METSNWVALGALLIAIISFIGQRLSAKKSNKASEKANEIQSEMYRLSKKIDDFENRKGEILLLNIIGRYFIVQLNCWDLSVEGDKPMKKDDISIKKYISELKQLSSDFNELVNNPFYIKFIEKHPDINLLILSLRGAIIERENSTELKVNDQTFSLFYKTYQELKSEIRGNKILGHKFFIECDEAAEYLNKAIKHLKQFNTK